MESMAGEAIYKWELIARDTIYRDGNKWQAIQYTEMGGDGRGYDIQKWEMMAWDTIYRGGNCWQAIRYTEMGTDGRRYDLRDGN